MKTSLAVMVTTTLIFIGATGTTGSSVSIAADGVDQNPGMKYQEIINRDNGASVPPVATDVNDESINVSAIPARFIYVKFPGEDSRIITLQELDSTINERAIQIQEVPNSSTN